MGDVPPPSSQPNEYSAQDTYSSISPSSPLDESQTSFQPSASMDNSTFQPQFPQQFDPSSSAFSSPFDMSHQQGRPSPYNMSAMANALPQARYQQGYAPGAQQRYSQSGPSSGMVQQIPQMGQYSGQAGINPLAGTYYLPQQMQSYYGSRLAPSQQQTAMSPRHNMLYYPNQVMMSQTQQHLSGGYYYPNQFTTQSSAVQGQLATSQYLSPDPTGPSPAGFQEQSGGVVSAARMEEGPKSRPNVVRGPPRKPRQSGHAIWVGNLPPQTDLMSLVHHVCKEALGLESLFLISKSNCAFANFKDEESCIKAQQKLHDSKFQSVRLVSRLRKSTVEGNAGQTAPTGPASPSPTARPEPNDSLAPPHEDGVDHVGPVQESQRENNSPSMTEVASQKDRFFILKSLTVEDLELSVRNGVWATQSHNEETLNSAFTNTDNVYLVFSANKSGEYFGYARMVSPINTDPAAAIEFAPKAQATSDLDLPKAIPTEATENCPRGNIIDDSARGTIFWEVERDETDTPEPDSEGYDSGNSAQDTETGPKAWGKPFKLEWMSTTRLPFYRTRGLRNPWNSNREVKIARDGTELEPSVGRRLIGLFNRVQSPAPMSMGMRHGMPMAGGYPPTMRPVYPQ